MISSVVSVLKRLPFCHLVKHHSRIGCFSPLKTLFICKTLKAPRGSEKRVTLATLYVWWYFSQFPSFPVENFTKDPQGHRTILPTQVNIVLMPYLLSILVVRRGEKSLQLLYRMAVQ